MIPPVVPSPWATLTYREALVLCEGLFVLRETLQGIKVQPLHDGHKLPRAGLEIGEERESGQWLMQAKHRIASDGVREVPGPSPTLPFSTHTDLHDLLGSQAPNEGIDGCQVPSSHICQLPDEVLIQTLLLHSWQGSSIHSLG